VTKNSRNAQGGEEGAIARLVGGVPVILGDAPRLIESLGLRRGAAKHQDQGGKEGTHVLFLAAAQHGMRAERADG